MAPLYGIGFYIFLVIVLLVNLKVGFKEVRENIKREWKYLILPLLGGVYLVIHYFASLIFIPDIPYKPSWSTMELLLLYFFLIPLYVLSARSFLTPVLLRQGLLGLCWGILALNVVKLFYITELTLFTDPSGALNHLLVSRFGGNMAFLGGFVYLEPQAIYLVISALIGYFFILKHIQQRGNRRVLVSSIIIFILSLIFLFFTVTKGAILAFAGGFLVLSVVYFRKMPARLQWGACGVFLMMVAGVFLLLPPAYMTRLQDMKREIVSVQEGEFSGGSIGPRAGLLKENFKHFNQFGWGGLGVYKKAATRDWYAHSPYIKVEVTNAHNSFVEFWLRGGILGLFFILYFFLAPLIRMIKRRKFIYLVLAIVIAFFIGNNTCVLIILADSCPFVVMLLAMGYLYPEQFYQLQETEIS